jgi:hypothetical protein
MWYAANGSRIYAGNDGPTVHPPSVGAELSTWDAEYSTSVVVVRIPFSKATVLLV